MDGPKLYETSSDTSEYHHSIARSLVAFKAAGAKPYPLCLSRLYHTSQVLNRIRRMPLSDFDPKFTLWIIVRMNPSEDLAQRQRLTENLYQTPYDACLYLDRAKCYEELGFPDLAAGDAYKALLLTDEAQDESGEHHAQALEAIEACGGPRLNGCTSDREGDLTGKLQNGENADHRVSHEDSIKACALASFQLLSRNLLRCGCLESAFDFCLRGLQLDPNDVPLTEQKIRILERNRQSQLQRNANWDESLFDPKKDLPDEGSVRRELYPWNTYEPDRFSSTSLSFLNAEMAAVAPKCSVLAVDLPLLTEDSSVILAAATIKQLGIFAKEDISPGETVLHESSILTANNRLHDPLCDACSSELPAISTSQPLYACLDCDDTVFCSLKCHDDAMFSYHPSICGKELDFIGRETKPKDAANALYLLLLGRTMALAETQDLHPLELKETKYIWGDFIHPDSTYLHSSSASNFSIARHLPFSFTFNILSPLHILEKMDVDIFADLHKYDIWIFNTLYAKFRGTASARLNTRDGKPEVCAVHPMWCLANHSCASNVRWEWGGEVQFWARGGDEVVRWGPYKEEVNVQRWQGGIKKGEEILNHYCDVGLDVEKRREWAVGALGGMCVCDRCRWEDGKGRQDTTYCNASKPIEDPVDSHTR